MTLTIELTPEQESRLVAVARREGLEPEELAQRLVTEYLPGHGAAPQTMPPEEKIHALDALAEQNRHLPVLPPEAFERESLYDERL